MKEYNVKRNYVTKHANMYESSNKKSEKNKLTILKKSIKAQQSVFIRASRDALSSVKLSFKTSEAIAKNCRPFSNNEFISDCMVMFVDQMCSEKKELD